MFSKTSSKNKTKAIKNGSSTYIGSSCKNCSNNLKYTSSGNCVDCDRDAGIVWAEKNKNKLKKYHRKYHLKTKYNITPEQYDELVLKQEGRCAICNKFQPKLYVDHSHITKKVRELLCHRCNVSLGLLDEDLSVIYNMINYLKRHDGGLSKY